MNGLERYMMENWQIAVILRPIFALILFGLVALPIRWVYQKYAKDSWLKRLLLKRIGDSRNNSRSS